MLSATCNATACPNHVCPQAKGLNVGGADDSAGAAAVPPAVAISAERADTAERTTHGITGPELARMMGRGAPEICEDHGSMAATPKPQHVTVTAVTHPS